MIRHHAHDMPFGAMLGPDGGARFALWAPAPADVALVHSRDGRITRVPARRIADGWREVVLPHARAGDRYQWAVAGPDGEVRVPDPASRSNPEGVFEPSELVDPNLFSWDDGWTGRPWHECVFYELHVGTFTRGGTFTAAAAELDRLANLGVTALQLMPLSTFPGRFGWGYDGVLPFAPHPAYGTPDDLKAFVQAAHRRGLMVFLDVVYNHFGPDGNFLRAYAPDFFTDRHHNAWGDAINFDGPGSGPVRQFFIHNALYWLEEFRFDGLRLDAVHAMQDDGSPHILEELSRRVRTACAGRHVHLVLENDVNEAHRLADRPEPGRYDGQWSGDFHHTLHVRLTGEHEGYYGEYAEAPLPQLARALTQGFAREGEPHLGADDRHAANPRRDATSTVPLPATVNFLQNHDQIGNRAFGERLAALVDEAPRRLATALLLLCPPVPMLFMGEEWDAPTPFLYFADWQGALRDAVVDGRRREFAKFSAFADPSARERIPDPCDAATAEQCRLDIPGWSRDPARVAAWDHHRRLLAVRHAGLTPHLPRLRTGDHVARVLDDEVMAIEWRFDGGRALELVANLSGQPVDWAEANRPDAVTWFIVGEVTSFRIGAWSARWRWREGGP